MTSLSPGSSDPDPSSTPRRRVDPIDVIVYARAQRSRHLAFLLSGVALRLFSALDEALILLGRKAGAESKARAALRARDRRLLRDLGLTAADVPYLAAGRRLPRPHPLNDAHPQAAA